MSDQDRAATSKSWKRLDGVDLIRGLAILFVLMNHVNMQLLFAHVPYTKDLPAQLVSSLVWNGQHGVQMFFAVSGFLITATSIRRWGSLGELRTRDFYLLRFARIVPLLLLLLVVLSALHLAHIDHFVISKKVASLETALLAALTFRINVLEATRGYLPGNWDVLWSLSVEEMFYLFFPLACLLFKRLRVFIVVLSIFVALGPFGRTVLSHGNEVWHEYSYLGSMDAIALGSLTALLVTRVRLQRKALWSLGIIGGGFVLFILMFSIKAGNWGVERSGLDMTVLAAGTCMLIAVATVTRWRSPAALAPLRWLGQHSYEIYLSHMFIVVAIFGLYLRWGKSLRAVPAVFLAVIAAAGVLGDLVARFYSEPMNRLIRRWSGDDTGQMGSVIDVDQVSSAEPLAERTVGMMDS
jgi:peptidoglycan/LPS O-acetylase OafA/YrhL